MNEKEKQVVDEAIKYIKSLISQETTGHDYFHCIRVYKQAMKLAEIYQANEYIVALTALLHDLDDHKISPDTNHAEEFLALQNVKEADDIMYIINNMSFSEYQKGKRLISLEGKLVQDADRLDALGAMGIARCFAYGGSKERPIFTGNKEDDSAIAHFYQKLFLLPDLMNTHEAREIAEKRVEYMKEYLDNFYDEWEDLA